MDVTKKQIDDALEELEQDQTDAGKALPIETHRLHEALRRHAKRPRLPMIHLG